MRVPCGCATWQLLSWRHSSARRRTSAGPWTDGSRVSRTKGMDRARQTQTCRTASRAARLCAVTVSAPAATRVQAMLGQRSPVLVGQPARRAICQLPTSGAWGVGLPSLRAAPGLRSVELRRAGRAGRRRPQRRPLLSGTRQTAPPSRPRLAAPTGGNRLGHRRSRTAGPTGGASCPKLPPAAQVRRDKELMAPVWPGSRKLCKKWRRRSMAGPAWTGSGPACPGGWSSKCAVVAGSLTACFKTASLRAMRRPARPGPTGTRRVGGSSGGTLWTSLGPASGPWQTGRAARILLETKAWGKAL